MIYNHKQAGTTVDEVKRQAKAQDYRCAICKRRKVLVKDHSHTSGEFRGLLCSACNSGLGMFQDSIEVLKAAIKYLDR